MSLTYTWKITGLKKSDQVNTQGETLVGAVVQTYWECHGTDEQGNVGSFSGATPFTAENVPAGSFKPFNELTEQDVIGWIKKVVENDPSYKAHIDDQIMKQIHKPVVEDADLPWATTETPDPVEEPTAEEPTEE
jgi:hypothetical protein